MSAYYTLLDFCFYGYLIYNALLFLFYSGTMSLISIFFIHLLALASPGPDFVYVSQTAVNHSRKNTLWAIAGICTAIALWELLAICGLNVIIDHLPIIYKLLLLMGGSYLIYLGIMAIKSSFQTQALSISAQEQPTHQFFLKGLLTNSANPKALAYFGSIFSVAVAHASTHQLILMFIVVLVESIIWFYLVAYLFSMPWVATWYQKRLKIINIICGLAFTLFGLSLLYQLIKYLI